MRTTRAVTLVELMIVLVIIAILTLLAVPSATDTKARTDIAKARSDLRVIATALEAYAMDHHRYPAELAVLGREYLPFVPADPFSGVAPAPYPYLNTTRWAEYQPPNNYIVHRAWLKAGSWCLLSVGPDRDIYNTPQGFHPRFYRTFRDYDATNGLVSLGNIFRTRRNADALGVDSYFYLME